MRVYTYARFLVVLFEVIIYMILAANLGQYLGHYTALVMTQSDLTNQQLEEIYYNASIALKLNYKIQPTSTKEPTTYQPIIHTTPRLFIPDKPDTSPFGKPPDIPKKFLIEEADFCERRPGLEVIVYVHSAISRVKQRNITRSTWANASAYDMGSNSVNLGVVFMVGRPKDEQEQKIISEESKKYHDIVQGDYGEHYRLLTYKALASLYWVSRHCSNVPWMLHSDDDTYIDIFLFFKHLQSLREGEKRNFLCHVLRRRTPLRYGRWKVDYKEYSGRHYPRYCSGAVWFLQTKLASELLSASQKVPYLWVDDTYLTGLVAKKAGIGHIALNRRFGRWKRQPMNIGKSFAWFEMRLPRDVWWRQILNFHRNQTHLTALN